MARDNLYYDLVHAAEVEECPAHRELLYDAAMELQRLVDENEELKENRSSITMTVTLSAERIRETMNEAFENVIGKDLEYVCRAVHEKMEREGELVGEEEQESSENSE